jgi:hypothetical protein
MELFLQFSICLQGQLYLTAVDIDSIRGWRTANHMKLNVSKTRVIYFTTKKNMITCEQKLCASRIIPADTIKDLAVFLDSKLYFHQHVDYIFSQALKLLGLTRDVTFPFHLLSLLMLYFTLVRSKLEYASVAWNTLTSTDANKLECIQRKFLAPCYNRLFPHIHYSYVTDDDQMTGISIPYALDGAT